MTAAAARVLRLVADPPSRGIARVLRRTRDRGLSLFGRARRNWRALALVVVLLIGTLFAISANAGPVIPVPDALVKVHTVSGTVVRDRVIPLGGVPVPIDVDEYLLNGVLFPDVDVSVGLIAAEELPGKPIVPTIEVNRDATAILRHAPAPPLRIDFTIELKDAGNGLKKLATITYGYETPAGGLVPPRFKTKLVGPITGGFVDPLEAIVLTPGYSAPLRLNANVETETFKGKFGVGLDPIPQRLHFTEDPRDDGLDFEYDHQGPIPDIKLVATADLTDPSSGRLRHIDATVERLPQEIHLSNTNTTSTSSFEYTASSLVGKPDVSANYRDTSGAGKVITDAHVKVAGLPFHMKGQFGFHPNTEGGSDLDSADFEVLNGDQVDSVDFLARNYVGDPGPIPEPGIVLPPDQYVTVATRQMPDSSTRFRAAGRLLGIRSLHLMRTGDDRAGVDARTDMGDGTTPLRAIVDLDNRGPGGPADPDKRKRMKIDATVTPLPRQIHVNFDPARGNSPTHVLYESNQTVDVDTTATIADADTADGCGQQEVTCLTARIDKLPPRLEMTIPGANGTDFSLSHTGGSTGRPDVRATVDRTPVELNKRTYAEIGLLRVPNEVTGRMDSKDGVVRSAEFHACKFDFTANACTTLLDALGRVTFTVRDQPSRTNLPPRPDTTPMFVSLLARPGAAGEKHFEAMGRVDEVQEVAFHQRDENNDGKADGTLGARVNIGSGKQPFDVVVDSVSTDEEVPSALDTSKVKVNVAALPDTFSACVRSGDDVAPPDPLTLSADLLLADCDRTNVLGYGPTSSKGTLAAAGVTPLSAVYTAVDDAGQPAPTKVTANVSSESPDTDDGNRLHTNDLNAVIDQVPSNVRVDVIPPVTPENGQPGRKLEFSYGASSPVDVIDFDLASRRSNSLCDDPRPNKMATCVTGTLQHLPKTVTATYDPDESKGDIDVQTDAPGVGQERLSFTPTASAPADTPGLRVSSVSPDPEFPTDERRSSRLILEATIKHITDHLVGKMQHLDTDGEDPNASGPLSTRLLTCSDGIDNDSAQGTDADDPDCEPDMARVSFNACPVAGDSEAIDPSCNGIEKIDFRVTNALVGDPLEDIVVPAVSGVTQDFSFIERGAGISRDFKAAGSIGDFKQVFLSRIDRKDKISPTTRLRAAFGTGAATEKIHAYIDRDSGQEAQLIDGIIAQAPKAVNVCFRDKVDPLDVKSGSDYTYCDKAPANKLAVQARLDTAAGVNKPDITLRQLKLSKGAGAELLQGIPGPDPAVQIDDLGERIDMLAGKGDDTDVLVEGHSLSDNDDAPSTDDPDDVAGRVSFGLQNFKGGMGSGFPATSLNGSTDPESLASNAGNFVKVLKRDKALLLKGSVPHIKRISLRPEPCKPGDPRFPAKSDFPAASKRPDYTCIQAMAAAGLPLGVAVRTLDADGKALALDEGHLDTVPGGTDGLQATVGKAPDDTSLAPVCTSHAQAATAESCRPPLLSVEAPRSVGQVPHLQARLATGNLELLESLRDKDPLDELSDRLDYEQAPASYAGPGARIKIGTQKGQDPAIRAGFNLEVPQFLDLDPPTSYTCAHLDKNDVSNCEQEGVSSHDNAGYSATDLFIKLTGSNLSHGGSDLNTIGPNGRAALMVHDFDKEKQIIVTGAPDANGSDGTTTYTPERGNGDDPNPPGTTEPQPPSGAYDRGLIIPGRLDAKVYLRSDYNADDDHPQHTFIQVDGRVNNPLTMSLRMNEPDEKGRYGANYAGDQVPTKQFAVRNAPCTSATNALCSSQVGTNLDYAKPTFRIRAEVRPSKDEPKDDRCTGPDSRFLGFGVDFCVILPQPDTRWLNVDVNADPDGPGTGNAPARTIAAVADTKDKNFDLHGYANINDLGTEARFTPQAALRLENFELGFKLGAGIGIVGGSTEYSLNANVFPKVAGRNTEQTMLSQNAAAIRLGSRRHTSDVNVNMYGSIHIVVTAEALFGLISDDVLNETTPPAHLHTVFLECPDFQWPSFVVAHDGFSIDDSHDGSKAAITIQPSVSITGAFASVISALSDVAAPFMCFLGTNTDDLVTSSHPLPTWNEPNRPIDDVNSTSSTPASQGGQPVSSPERTDVDITGTQTFCNGLGAKTLHVHSGGFLRVGREGETLTTTGTLPDGTPFTTKFTCTGRLAINADNVVVDSGGTIDASRTRTTDQGGAGNAGTPSTGVGGGAGHAGSGGDSGSGGPGGGTYPIPSGGIGDDFGSPGRDGAGAAFATGGLGGGVLRIAAADKIDIQGDVFANGGNGIGAGSACTTTGGGGGSGGAIQLIANKVSVTGSGHVRVRGGFGGFGGNGGGGGGGGRVQIDTVQKNLAAGALSAAGQSGGAGASGCTAGDPGSTGNTGLGTTLDMAAGVTRTGTSTSPWVQGSVGLRLKAIQQNVGDPIRIIYCRATVPFGTADPFNNAGLDPPPVSDSADLVDPSKCDGVTPTSLGGGEYQKDVTVSGLADGYYGFYAFAATPIGFFQSSNDCVDNIPFLGGCLYQSLAPGRSTVKIGSDSTKPTLGQVTALNGTSGCESSSLCLGTTTGLMRIVANDGTPEGSGIVSVKCNVNGGTFTNCGRGDISIELGGQGLRTVNVRVEDQAGNVRLASEVGKTVTWFVDTVKPNKPSMTLTNVGTQNNGWYRFKPTLAVSATDPTPSVGFDNNGITVLVDEGETTCGTPGVTPDTNTIACSTADTAGFVPGNGIHTFKAYATDKLNHQSDTQDQCTGSVDPNLCTMKIDTNPPKSRLFLGPKKPDGSNGWYRMRPFFAFAATDRTGESGVDPALDVDGVGTGIYFKIDSGAYAAWDKTDDLGNRIPEGIHTICWYAKDLAGNTETEHCQAGIKVDTFAPSTSLPISPVAPNGTNSWYITTPTVTPGGTETVPNGLSAADTSGLAKAEYQIDDGAWTPAAPVGIAEGQHVIRVRAFDNAGNPAEVSERTVRVDKSDPTLRENSYPPKPNDQGWFRQILIDSLGASDGRDGSGADNARYGVNSSPTIAYLEPFYVGPGVNTVKSQPFDFAGRGGPIVTKTEQVDTSPPVPQIATPKPGNVLIPGSTTLRFNVTDALTPRVKVLVYVYNELGFQVRQMGAPGPYPGGYRDKGAGSVTWDGKNDSGKAVLPGAYHYRVQAIDQAGNAGISTESDIFLVVLAGLPI